MAYGLAGLRVLYMWNVPPVIPTCYTYFANEAFYKEPQSGLQDLLLVLCSLAATFSVPLSFLLVLAIGGTIYGCGGSKSDRRLRASENVCAHNHPHTRFKIVGTLVERDFEVLAYFEGVPA